MANERFIKTEVLIIDPDFSQAELIHRIIRPLGATITYTPDIPTAARFLERSFRANLSPRLIILSLEQETGRPLAFMEQLTAFAKRVNPQASVPNVLVMGPEDRQENAEKTYKNLGAIGYIPLPLEDVDIVSGVVQNALR